MEKLSFKLPDFEGPLDLLLYLVSKNKLNLADIPVAELVDQYLSHMEMLRRENMDIASEFLEMASRLVYLKTVMLLPKHEEAKELKAELEGQLREYALCQEMAAKLKDHATGFGAMVREPMKIEFDKAYSLVHQPDKLYSAYLAAVGRGERRLPPPVEAFAGIVKKRMVSVSSKIVFVIKSLWQREKMKFHALFSGSKSKSDIVATFLAVLELVKVRRVEVSGTGAQAEIKLNKAGGSDGGQ